MAMLLMIFLAEKKAKRVDFDFTEKIDENFPTQL